MPFLEYPFTDDPAAVTARILDNYRAALPGWVPAEGAPEVVLAEEIGREIADLLTLIVNVSDSIVTRLGTTVFQVPQLAGVKATTTATVQLARPGATIPAGFLFIARGADGADVGLQVPADVVVASAVSAVQVNLEALDVGTYANAIPAGDLRPATGSDVVVSAVATTASAGGVDVESDSAYRDRLVATLSTLTRTPILPVDFAVRARDVIGVTRALALDGYDPLTRTSGVERTITLVPLDPYGLPVSTAVATTLRDTLDALREVNFQVSVSVPTYTRVQVTFSAVAKAGATPATVRDAMVARGLELLNPATWGGGDTSPPTWTLTPTVRRNYLLAEMASVDGCAYVTALTVNGDTVDVTLPGVAPLPAPSDATAAGTLGVAPTTVSGSVVAA